MHEKIKKLRASEKWKTYYHNLRPRNENGEIIDFPKRTSSKGLSQKDFCIYIDKLVIQEVNYKNPKATFDNFYKSFKEMNKK